MGAGSLSHAQHNAVQHASGGRLSARDCGGTRTGHTRANLTVRAGGASSRTGIESLQLSSWQLTKRCPDGRARHSAHGLSSSIGYPSFPCTIVVNEKENVQSHGALSARPSRQTTVKCNRQQLKSQSTSDPQLLAVGHCWLVGESSKSGSFCPVLNMSTSNHACAWCVEQANSARCIQMLHGVNPLCSGNTSFLTQLSQL